MSNWMFNNTNIIRFFFLFFLFASFLKPSCSCEEAEAKQLDSFLPAIRYSAEEMKVPLHLLRALNGERLPLGVPSWSITWKDDESNEELEVARMSEEKSRFVLAMSGKILPTDTSKLEHIRNKVLSDVASYFVTEKEFVLCGYQEASKVACFLAKDLVEKSGLEERAKNRVKVFGISSLPLMINEDIDILYRHIDQNNILFFHGITDIVKKRFNYFSLGEEDKNYKTFGVPIALLPLDCLSYFITNDFNRKSFLTLASWSIMAYVMNDCSDRDLPVLASFLLTYSFQDFSSFPSDREIGLAMNYVVNRLNPDRGEYSPDELGVPSSYFGSRRFTSWIYGP